MNEASSSSRSTFPQELVDIIEEDKVSLYSNELRLESGLNYYQQADHRAIDVPIQCPVLIDYQSSFEAMENPKKRMNGGVTDQKAANKKLIMQQRSQGFGCVRERVPIRRSQKLADKITALQKLVSPYGKTDTASVLQEAHISINLLHEQIQKLLQIEQTSMINDQPLMSQNKETETSLHNKGLCLVPISSPEINNLCREEQYFMPRNY